MNPAEVLKNTFGYDEFRPFQQTAVHRGNAHVHKIGLQTPVAFCLEGFEVVLPEAKLHRHAFLTEFGNDAFNDLLVQHRIRSFRRRIQHCNIACAEIGERVGVFRLFENDTGFGLVGVVFKDFKLV